MKINVTQIDPAAARTLPAAPFGFGRIFTNHMITRSYREPGGWQDAELQPYAPIPMELSMSVLHYGQEIFEGTKAYRRPDGQINLFRIEQNIKRFNRSAVRMELPQMDEKEHLDAIIALMNLDKEWGPDAPNSSLYIRPTLISSENSISGRNITNPITFWYGSSP